jgi:hypothetical protein
MARTIQEIQAEIAAARQRQPGLTGLTSSSATSIVRLVEYVHAVCLFTLETLWDRFRAEVEATVAAAPVGTAEWYADRALEFQAGDQLVVLDNRVQYPAGSTGAKLITRAAAKETTTGKLLLKVAKAGPTPGTLASLSSQELTQARGYFDRIRFAGIRLEVVSREADRLRLTGEVYYDPLLDVATVQVAVRAAVNGYLANLDFAGEVYVSKLTDAIQAVAGVRDVRVLTVAARTGQVAPVLIPRVYETAAGYIVEEDAPGFTFLNTLQFLPDGPTS